MDYKSSVIINYSASLPLCCVIAEKDNSDDSVEDEMQVSHWSDMNATTASRSMFVSHQQISEQDHELQRTPVRRQNRSASRKNLSRSFSQILNEEFGDDADPEEEGRGVLPSIHSQLIANEVVMDHDDVFSGIAGGAQHQRQNLYPDQGRLFVRTLSTASDSTYRTDSGFNDDDLSSARSGHGSFSSPTKNQRLAMSNDVSMRSFRCD